MLRQRNDQLILGDVGKVEIALIGVLSVIWYSSSPPRWFKAIHADTTMVSAPLHSAAIQFRAWDHLRQPLPSLSRSSRIAQRERRAEEAEKRVTRHADELDEWEALHGKSGGMLKVERQRSGWASTSGSVSVRDGVVPVLGQQTVDLSDDDATAQQKTNRSLDEQENLLEEIQVSRLCLCCRSVNLLADWPFFSLRLSGRALRPFALDQRPPLPRPRRTTSDIPCASLRQLARPSYLAQFPISRFTTAQTPTLTTLGSRRPPCDLRVEHRLPNGIDTWRAVKSSIPPVPSTSDMSRCSSPPRIGGRAVTSRSMA